MFCFEWSVHWSILIGLVVSSRHHLIFLCSSNTRLKYCSNIGNLFSWFFQGKSKAVIGFRSNLEQVYVTDCLDDTFKWDNRFSFENIIIITSSQLLPLAIIAAYSQSKELCSGPISQNETRSKASSIFLSYFYTSKNFWNHALSISS